MRNVEMSVRKTAKHRVTSQQFSARCRQRQLRASHLALLMILGVVGACRDFSGSSGTAGRGAASGSDGHAGGAGAADPDGASGAPEYGGAAGAVSSGARGGDVSGDSESGADSNGNGGAGGSDAEASPAGNAGAAAVSEPDDNSVVARFGLVSVIVNGEYVCSGMLLTNSWVLTADQCAPPAAAGITISYGATRAHPSQSERVSEIVRFPGNDGSAELRGRDIVLLGVEAPMRVGGKTDGVFRRLPPLDSSSILTRLRCAGWELGRDAVTEEDEPDLAQVTSFHVDLGVTQGGRSLGDRLWFQTVPGADVPALLPSSQDLGSVCFLSSASGDLPISVYNGSTNDGQEFSATSLLDGAVRGWLDATLIEPLDETDAPDVTGGVSGCQLADKSLEIFSVNDAGEAEQRSGLTSWSLPESLAHPANRPLAREAIGTLCRDGVTQAIFARAVDGSLWWRQRDGDGAWTNPWDQILDSAATTANVVALDAERFDLFTALDTGELHRLSYRNGWLAPENLTGGLMSGGFSGVAWNSERVDVFGVGSDGTLWQQWRYNGAWQGWASPWIPTFRTIIDKEVSAVLQDGAHLDLFARSLNGVLLHSFYNINWLSDWIDTGVALPTSQFNVVAGLGVRKDILAVGADGRLWHGVWPRLPKMQKSFTFSLRREE
jgi:hypothetical protein